MRVWYTVEIQMSWGNERNYDLDMAVGQAMGFIEDDIDERETYRMTAIFPSEEILPMQMRGIVRKVLRDNPTIFYIDVVYRWETENIPDRFVIWHDGHAQEYIGRIVFEEDKFR